MLRANRTKRSPSDHFDEVFERHLATNDDLCICVGYCGDSVIQKYTQQLVDKAKNGNRVRLILGMYSVAGTIKPLLYSDLLSLHNALKKANKGSGVFLTIIQYHGKIYDFGTEIWLGSSNFSNEGLHNRREATVKLTDSKQIQQVRDLIRELGDAGASDPSCVPLDMINVNVPPPLVTLASISPIYSLPSNLEPDGGSIELPLHVDQQPISGLNLCLGKGRFESARGKYQPRPWYEIEISSDKDTYEKELYPKVANTKPQKVNKPQKTVNQCEFRAYLYDGKVYRFCKLQTYSDHNKAMGSSPRTILGEFIKGQLEKAGVLHAPDAITSDTLRAYGRDTITLTRYKDRNVKVTEGVRNKVYVLDFSVPKSTSSAQNNNQS